MANPRGASFQKLNVSKKDANGCVVKNNFNPLDPCNLEGNNTSINGSSDSGSTISSITTTCGEDNPTIDFYNNIQEQLNNLFGVDVLYWKYRYDLQKDHPLYGEMPEAAYEGPYLLKANAVINSDVSILQNIGYDTENDVDMEISFNAWNSVIGNQDGPLPKDVFTFQNILCQAPSGFERVYFEVTEQSDGSLDNLFLGQKYAWVIKGKRHDFSYSPNEPEEQPRPELFDQVDTGIVGEEEVNIDNQDNDEQAQMDFVNPKSGVYGNYYE